MTALRWAEESPEKRRWARSGLTPEEEARFTKLAEAKIRLAGFVRRAWHIVEPQTPYYHGKHIEVICEHLEAVAQGLIEKLLINIPPRFMKSLLVAAFFPAWVWGPHGDPGARFMFVSFRERLAMRDSLRTRRIITSPWYQNTWPRVKLETDQNEKMRFDNTLGGFRIAAGMEGATGEGADFLCADDPHDAAKIWSEAKRESVKETWDDALSSRTGRWATNRKIVVMQRLHERDLSGHILAEKGDYVHLFLPHEYDPELRPGRAGVPARSIPSPLGKYEWRTKPGQLLWPERFPRPVVQAIKTTEMTPYAYSGQHQQVPSPPEGSMFRREHWRYWEPPNEDFGPVVKTLPSTEGPPKRLVIIPRKLPFIVDQYVQSWDFTFKGQAQARGEVDNVAGHVYAKAGTDTFLMDRINQAMDFPATIRGVRAVTERWPEAETKYYEDAANGPAIAATLRGEIPGMIAVPTGGDNLIARANAVSWVQSSGHLYLPHPVMCPWVTELEEILAAFPHAAHDDDMAALVTAVRKLYPLPQGMDRTDTSKAGKRTRKAYPIMQQH